MEPRSPPLLGPVSNAFSTCEWMALDGYTIERRLDRRVYELHEHHQHHRKHQHEVLDPVHMKHCRDRRQDGQQDKLLADGSLVPDCVAKACIGIATGVHQTPNSISAFLIDAWINHALIHDDIVFFADL